MLNYKIVPWTIIDGTTNTAKTKYVARLEKQPTLKTEELCLRMEKSSTLSRYEAALALGEMKHALINCLKNGIPVQIGEIGFLYLKIDSKTADTKEEAGFDLIKGVSIKFKPSEELKKAIIEEIKYKKVEQ